MQSSLWPKTSGRAWYHHLKSFLISHEFQTHPALPCVFILKDTTGFVILAVYVDDLKSIGTPTLSKHVEILLIKYFEMKVLGRTSYCLGLQIKHYADGSLLLHQQTYMKKLLRTFNMDNANALLAPMIGIVAMQMIHTDQQMTTRRRSTSCNT